MQTMPFRGAEKLVALVDDAVQEPTTDEVTASIKRALCKLVSSGEMEMPDCVMQPVEDHYARRLLYRSEDNGYSVVAMTWGPEQGTPIHDHAGLWCVEAVCCGRIHVVQYELVEEKGNLCKFEARGEETAGVGTAGCLIPPHEHHSIWNATDNDTAVTLHIYGGDMEHCCTFTPADDLANDKGAGWFVRERKSLCFDAA